MKMEKEELLGVLKRSDKVLIELGCGPNKKPGVIGIDHLDLPGVDYVTNLEEGLPFLPDNSVDEFYSRHVLEHIENLELLIKDIHRTLKPEGRTKIIVPHFSNPHYYSDFTHKRFFGLYTFDYFSRTEDQLKRKVPAFYVDYHFKVVHRKLIFKSPDHLLRHTFKKFYQRVFNFNSWWQEWYEESFCYSFPCQEIEFILEPIKSLNPRNAS